MNLPGFSAAASLSRTINGYYFQPSAAGRSAGGGVVASRDDRETFNCGPCSELPGPDGKEAEFVAKWCCDAVSGQNCQFKSYVSAKRKGFGAILV
jgi:hypothetical protein